MTEQGTWILKKGLAEMLKGGVIIASCNCRAGWGLCGNGFGKSSGGYSFCRWSCPDGRSNFAAEGVATPADAALMMQLGTDGVFVGSGIFKSEDPASRAQAIVRAVTHFRDPQILADVSQGLGQAMAGSEISSIPASGRMQERGW